MHPKPHQYQLLYSWIENLAEIYGISFRHFCKNVLELTPEEIADLRKILPERALLILSNGTGVPIDDLRKRDLHTIYKILCDELNQFAEAHPEELASMINKCVYKL